MEVVVWLRMEGEDDMSGQTACVKCENVKSNHISSMHTYYPGFGSVQALGGLDGASPHWGRAIHFPESTDLSASVIWKHPERHTQKCLIWASCGPVKLTHNINHTLA